MHPQKKIITRFFLVMGGVFFLLLLITILLLRTGGTISFTYPSVPTTSRQPAVPDPSSTAYPPEKFAPTLTYTYPQEAKVKKYDHTPPAISPDGIFSASLTMTSYDDGNIAVSLGIGTQGPWEKYRVDTTRHNITLWQDRTPTIPKSYMETLYTWEYSSMTDGERRSLLAWSPDGKKLAVFLPDRILIYTGSYLQNEPHYIDYLKKTIVFDTTFVVEHEIPVPLSAPAFDSIYSFRMFFSGDSQQLYATTSSGEPTRFFHYTLTDATLRERTFPTYDVYPIPNSSGLAYWYENGKMTWEENGTTKQYKSLTGADRQGQILISPDRHHMCLELSSSGYHGYSVVSFPLFHVIATGPQYSYCRRWLDEKTIVVHESLFNGGGQYWYLIDAKTGKKTLLDRDHGTGE